MDAQFVGRTPPYNDKGSDHYIFYIQLRLHRFPCRRSAIILFVFQMDWMIILCVCFAGDVWLYQCRMFLFWHFRLQGLLAVVKRKWASCWVLLLLFQLPWVDSGAPSYTLTLNQLSALRGKKPENSFTNIGDPGVLILKVLIFYNRTNPYWRCT